MTKFANSVFTEPECKAVWHEPSDYNFVGALLNHGEDLGLSTARLKCTACGSRLPEIRTYLDLKALKDFAIKVLGHPPGYIHIGILSSELREE